MTAGPAPPRSPVDTAADTAARTLFLRMFGAMLATQESFAAYLGAKLGLYAALHERGPATVGELADHTGVAPRYLREWLEQQAIAGLVAVDDPRRPWPLRTYRLPAGHERVLLPSADPLSLTAAALLPVGGVAGALPDLLAAFRTGAGVPADRFGADWRHGHGGANRAVYTHRLAGWLEHAEPELLDRLARTGGRILDVGCGAGWASIAVAVAAPAATVLAIDLDAESALEARANVEAARLAGRIEVRAGDVAELPGQVGLFDLICLFDVVHELGAPVPVLRACRRLLAPAGVVLILDSRVADTFNAPGDDIERFQYATSVLHCLPTGLVGGGTGAGTVLRQSTVRGYAAAAAFSDVRCDDLDDPLHRLYRLR